MRYLTKEGNFKGIFFAMAIILLQFMLLKDFNPIKKYNNLLGYIKTHIFLAIKCMKYVNGSLFVKFTKPFLPNNISRIKYMDMFITVY